MRRLEVAGRGTEVLDQKRRTLLRERQRTAVVVAEATEVWERLARVAAQANDRALALAGERRLRLAAVHRGRPATAEVTWKNTIGTVIPTGVRLDLADPPDFVALGGGSAVALAADAHRQALAAAAEHAVARAAHEAIEAELAATTRRLRAIERRWIPEHEGALRRLELELAERDLEDIARARFARARA
ncbi:MAG: V-type ATP synthase subunit D [Gaiella sp.]|nr:V-type ATP synthase subunit D [Gaiella sp.]